MDVTAAHAEADVVRGLLGLKDEKALDELHQVFESHYQLVHGWSRCGDGKHLHNADVFIGIMVRINEPQMREVIEKHLGDHPISVPWPDLVWAITLDLLNQKVIDDEERRDRASRRDVSAA